MIYIMGKNGKFRNKYKKRDKYRIHIKINSGNKVLQYHIFIFEGETVACIEQFTKNKDKDKYDYSFIKSGLNIIEYADFIKSKPGLKENLHDEDIEKSISKIKCKIVSDLKYLNSDTVNEYLHYIYEVFDCDKKIINV